jgi:hypothetical protein
LASSLDEPVRVAEVLERLSHTQQTDPSRRKRRSGFPAHAFPDRLPEVEFVVVRLSNEN